MLRALPFVLLLSLAALGCRPERGEGAPAPSASNRLATVPAPGPTADTLATTLPPGNVEHGRLLAAEFECSRCHEGTGHPAAVREKHCTSCHADILRGKFPAPPDVMLRWSKNVRAYRTAPSLVGAGKRFRREWVEAFLLSPFDLRPHLVSTMPRLALDAVQARDLATYLTRDAEAPPAVSIEGASAPSGKRLFEAKACGGCHAFTGASDLGIHPDPARATTDDAALLAPDLRFARERSEPAALVRWLLDPKAVKSDALMPSHGLSLEEARDLVAFVVETPLAPPKEEPALARLPVLERKVSFDEVYDKVLRITCRHCHSDPDASLGDGGPGNTGGYGFHPRGLDLATYRGVAAGFLDDHDERQSIFANVSGGTPWDGTPRLVAALLARREEERGHSSAAIRGMPLGLPSVSAEQIQIVESWIAQGRPR